MQCNFVTLGDFVKSMHPSGPQVVSLDQYYSLTGFLLYAIIKEADAKKLYRKAVYMLAALIYVLVYFAMCVNT